MVLMMSAPVASVCQLTGRGLVTVSAGGKMQMWDTQSAKVAFALQAIPANTVLTVPFKDGQTDTLCSATEDGSVYHWNLTTLQCDIITKYDSSILFMAQSKDGSLCIASGRKIDFWSSPSSGIQPQELASEEADIRCVILLRDGEVCYATDLDVKIWDFKSETVNIRSDDERSEAMSLFQLEDGSICLVSKRSIRKLSPKSGQVTLVMKSDDFWSWMSVSTLLMDGRLCIASNRGGVHVINLEAGRIDLTWGVTPVTAVLQLKDGNVCIALTDYTIQIMDISTGRLRRLLVGHTDRIVSLIQLEDGRICSASSDKSLRLWRTEMDSFVPPSPASKSDSPPFKQNKDNQSTISENSAAKLESSKDPHVPFQFVPVAKIEPSKIEPSVLIIQNQINGSLIRCEIYDSIAILMAADNFLISLSSDADVDSSRSLISENKGVEIQKNSDFGDVYVVRFVDPKSFSELLERAEKLGLKPFPNYLSPTVSCATEDCPGRTEIFADGYSSLTSPFGIHYDTKLIDRQPTRTVLVGLLEHGFGEHNYITRYSRAQHPVADPKYEHGTHCAGLIAANNNLDVQMKGVADNAFLVYFCLKEEHDLTINMDEAIAKYGVDKARSLEHSLNQLPIKVEEVIALLGKKDARILLQELSTKVNLWYTSDAVRCLEEIAQSSVEVLNISLSWSGDFHVTSIDNMLGAIRQSMRRVINGGSRLVVVSAGNDGRDLDPVLQNTPEQVRFVDVFAVLPTGDGQDLASCMISVAASDVFGHLAPFSNFGQKTVTLAALGERVLSTLCRSKQLEEDKYQEEDKYLDKSGTSMSAPLVSGALAILIARFPFATKRELKQRLIDTADKEVTLRGKCVAGGRLNLNRAFRMTLFGPFGKMPDMYGREAENIREIIKDIDSIENTFIEVHSQLEMAFIGHVESEEQSSKCSSDILQEYEKCRDSILESFNSYCSSDNLQEYEECRDSIIFESSNSYLNSARDRLESLQTDSGALINRLKKVVFEFVPPEGGLRKIAQTWKESEIQRLTDSIADIRRLISEFNAMINDRGVHHTFLRFWARQRSAKIFTDLKDNSKAREQIVEEIPILLRLYEDALKVARDNMTLCENEMFEHLLLYWDNEVKWIQRQINWWKEKRLPLAPADR